MTNDTDIREEINVRLLREELWLTSGTLMTRLLQILELTIYNSRRKSGALSFLT
jgi:hypothetical protein